MEFADAFVVVALVGDVNHSELELVIDFYSVQVRCISLERSEIQLLVQINYSGECSVGVLVLRMIDGACR